MASRTRSAKIHLTVVRDNSVRNTIRGVTADMQREAKTVQRAQEKASKDAARVAAKAERDKQHAIAKTSRDEQKAAQQRVKAAERAAAQELRIKERNERWKLRVAVNSYRMEERARRQADREQERGAERRRTRGAAVGAAVVGAGFGAVGAARDVLGRAQSIAGVDSLEGRIQKAGEFQAELIRQSRAAGMDKAQRDQVQQRVLTASTTNNIDITDLMSGLATAQSRFSAFGDFAGIIDKIAAASAGTGATVEELVGALGSAREAFGLTTDEMVQAMDIFAAAGAEGAIDAKQLANEFAATLASTQRATGRKGVAGLREAVATAEALGTGQLSAAETATVQERLLDDLTSKDTQKKLKKVGIQTTDATGALLPIMEIAKQFATNEKFQKASTRQDIFTDVRGRKGAEILMSLMQKDSTFFDRVQNIDAGKGSQLITGTRDEIMGTEFAKLQNVAFQAQAETVANAEQTIAAFRKQTEALTMLEAKWPLVATGLDMFSGALKGAISGLMAMAAGRVAMGAAGVGGAGGGVATALGGAGAASGKLGKLGTAGALLSAGVAGYELGNALGLDKVGEQFGAWLAGQIHDLGDRGGTAPGAPSKTELTIKVDGAKVTGMTQAGSPAPVEVISSGRRGTNG